MRAAIVLGAGPLPPIPVAARRWLDRTVDGTPGRWAAILGPRKARAFLCYDMEGHTLWASGTWVSPAHRGNGLAGLLWMTVLTIHDVRNVKVVTVSAGGRGLIESVSKQFPDIRFGPPPDTHRGPPTG